MFLRLSFPFNFVFYFIFASPIWTSFEHLFLFQIFFAPRKDLDVWRLCKWLHLLLTLNWLCFVTLFTCWCTNYAEWKYLLRYYLAFSLFSKKLFFYIPRNADGNVLNPIENFLILKSLRCAWKFPLASLSALSRAQTLTSQMGPD